MDYALDILKEAKRRGWNATDLSPSQYRALTIAVRSKAELARDATAAAASRFKTGVLGVRVPLEIYTERDSLCSTCPRLRKFSTGGRACDACNCKNKWLESKLHDPDQECPLGKWAKHGTPTVAGERVTSGSAVAAKSGTVEDNSDGRNGVPSDQSQPTTDV